MKKFMFTVRIWLISFSTPTSLCCCFVVSFFLQDNKQFRYALTKTDGMDDICMLSLYLRMNHWFYVVIGYDCLLTAYLFSANESELWLWSSFLKLIKGLKVLIGDRIWNEWNVLFLWLLLPATFLINQEQFSKSVLALI